MVGDRGQPAQVEHVAGAVHDARARGGDESEDRAGRRADPTATAPLEGREARCPGSRASRTSGPVGTYGAAGQARRAAGHRVMSPPSSTTVPVSGDADTGDDVEQRGLTGAIRADQAAHLARVDGKVDVGEGGDPAEVHAPRARAPGQAVPGIPVPVARLDRRHGCSTTSPVRMAWSGARVAVELRDDVLAEQADGLDGKVLREADRQAEATWSQPTCS